MLILKCTHDLCCGSKCFFTFTKQSKSREPHLDRSPVLLSLLFAKSINPEPDSWLQPSDTPLFCVADRGKGRVSTGNWDKFRSHVNWLWISQVDGRDQLSFISSSYTMSNARNSTQSLACVCRSTNLIHFKIFTFVSRPSDTTILS